MCLHKHVFVRWVQGCDMALPRFFAPPRDLKNAPTRFNLGAERERCLLEAAGRFLTDHRRTGQQETFRVEEIRWPDSFRAGGRERVLPARRSAQTPHEDRNNPLLPHAANCLIPVGIPNPLLDNHPNSLANTWLSAYPTVPGKGSARSVVRYGQPADSVELVRRE